MVVMEYKSPADGQFKPIFGGGGGGMTQVEGDARYLMSGFRNVLRNGDFQVAQRGNGPFAITSTPKYTIDGLGMESVGGVVTLNRSVQPPGLGAPQAVVATAGQTQPSHYTALWMAAEDVETLSGRTVTLSFTAKSLSGTPKIGVGVQQVFGYEAPASSPVTTMFGTVAISTTMARYSITGTIPSTAGKTRYVQDALWLLLKVSGMYADMGLQNNTIYITDVQLEAGTVATPFERLPVQQQLAWCQRYFMRWTAPPLRGGVNGTAASRLGAPFPVSMRAIPTTTLGGPALQVFDGADSALVTIVALGSFCSRDVAEFDATLAASLTIGRPCIVFQGQNGYIDFSAEL